jgi:hypothetical protein
MSKNRWTKDEELLLIKDIASGINIDIIAKTKNRSSSAIELRLKKIIYENISSGKNINDIAKILNINIDKIRQYFYSYKDFKEKHTGIVDNVMMNKNIAQIKDNLIDELHMGKNNAQFNDIINKNNIHIGGNGESIYNEKIKKQDDVFIKSKIDKKLNKLELENKALKLIVENKDLTNKINNMISEGNIDKNIKKIIKNIRKL